MQSELDGFIGLLRERGVRRYLEIGAREGDTFHAVMLSLPAGSFGVAVDMPGGMWGKVTTAKSLNAVADALGRDGREARVILGDSTDIEIVRQVAALAPFDAVLIDGDHRYAGVLRDWCNYGDAPIVAFHDIVGDGQCEKVHGNAVEVPRLWREIKRSQETVEFVSPGSKMGLGCVLR